MTEDLDEIYRRASALDPSRPSEAVRRRVLEHAAALAARPRRAANRARRRPAIFGTLAAAALAGLLVIPRVFNPHPPAELAGNAGPVKAPPAPPLAGAPPAAALPNGGLPSAGALSSADTPSINPAPAPPQIAQPKAGARSRAVAPDDEPAAGPGPHMQSLAEATPRAADASRQGASRLDAAAQSGTAAQPGLVGGHAATPVQPASPPTDQSAALRQAAETGDVRRLQAILGDQVRVDAPDARGRTALMLAASGGQAESVDLLLAHGADPNAADADGTTPLKAALAADQPAIVAALRRAGAR